MDTSIILIWYDRAGYTQRAALAKLVEVAGRLEWEVEKELFKGVGSTFWDKVEQAIKDHGRKFLTTLVEDWKAVTPWQMERIAGMGYPAAEDSIREVLYGRGRHGMG